MMLSDAVDMNDVALGKFRNKFCPEGKQRSNGSKKVMEIQEHVLAEMSESYPYALTSRMNKEGMEYSSYVKTEGKTDRVICLHAGKQSKSSYVFIRKNEVSRESDMIFGRIKQIFDHSWRENNYTWVLLEVFSDVLYTDGFWNVSERVCATKPFLIDDVSVPQVVARENERLVFVSTDVRV